MTEPMYNTQGDFATNVVRLVSQSDKFLESIKSIKSLQSGTTGALENIKKSVYAADVSNVSNIGIDLEALENELKTLLQKFYVVQNSYKRDSTMSSFLGNFSKNPQDAYTKLVGYSDGCIQQIDAVITAYSRIEQRITKANLWIRSMLSNYSPKSVSEKARNSKIIINELSKIVSQIRDMSHNAKLELLNIRNLSAKHIKTGPQAVGQ